MGAIDGRTWLEHIPPPECWRLLFLSSVGRLGVIVNSAPEIYPVNFVVHNESIVFRTDRGSKLSALARTPSVCFEADGLNHDDHTGWSVLVKGTGAELTTADAVREATELPLQFWPMGEKSHWIRITPTEVTGRRTYRR